MAKEILTETSFIVDGKYLYEMVGDAESKVLSYVRYDKLSGEISLQDRVEIDGRIMIPPQNNLPFTGTLLLPTYPEEYESFGTLLENVRSFINKYLELPSDYLLIASYYVLLTWVFDCFEAIPYLRARGEYGTGKSRFLRVVGSLCYKPCFAGGSSTVSPIFRLIDMYGGLTLVLDEADFRFSGPDAEIVKILNTGYMKGCPVLRTEGDKPRVPTAYNTYGPKIIATRKEFSDLALESRCLTNYMTPMTRQDIPLHLPSDFARSTLRLRNQLLMFRFKHYGEYEIDGNQRLPGVEPRINQVLLPLFALADNNQMIEELKAFARKHAKKQVNGRSETLEADVLYMIIEIAKINKIIPLKEIASRLNKGRDKEQGEYVVSPAKVGRINKISFGFETRRTGAGTDLVWDGKLGKSLCERYSIDSKKELDFVNSMNFVNDVNDDIEAKINPQDKKSPEQAYFEGLLDGT